MSKKHFELLKTLDGHTDAVWGSCCSSKGDQLFTASWDGTIGSWDIITGEQTQSCQGHSGKVFCVAAGDDMQGSVLVSGGEDHSIRSWNVIDGTCEGTMDDAHDGSVYDVKVLPSNKSEAVVIMSVGADAVLNLWTLEPGQNPSVHAIKDQHDGPIYTCAFDSRGLLLATGSSDTTIRLYDAETGTPVSLLGTMGVELTSPELGHSSTVACVEFFKSQPHMILSAGWDSSFKIWDTRLNQGCVMTTENAHSEIVSCCTSLGDYWAVTGSSDSTVKVWDIRGTGIQKKTGKLSTASAACVETLDDHITSICSLTMCAGDAQLITTGGDRTVRQFTACMDHNAVDVGCGASCTVQ